MNADTFRKRRAVYVSKHRQKKKDWIVAIAGGKCELCGYCKSNRALDFHHIDPNSKLFGIANAGATKSNRTLLEEAKKCVLLCANCHREVEAGETDISAIIDRADYIASLERELENLKIRHLRSATRCPVCGEETKSKFCSRKCFHKSLVVKPPEREILAQLPRNYAQLGLLFGVSGNTVKKWMLMYGL